MVETKSERVEEGSQRRKRFVGHSPGQRSTSDKRVNFASRVQELEAFPSSLHRACFFSFFNLHAPDSSLITTTDGHLS